MPHYKNGREAKSGDPVVGVFGYPAQVRAGTLHSIVPGQACCNGMVAEAVPGGTTQNSVTVGELLHAEDAFNALNEQLQPQPVQAAPPPPPMAADPAPAVDTTPQAG